MSIHQCGTRFTRRKPLGTPCSCGHTLAAHRFDGSCVVCERKPAPSCSTCRWWCEPDTRWRAPYGSCSRLVGWSSDSDDGAVLDPRSCGADLLTLPTFSCALWQPELREVERDA